MEIVIAIFIVVGGSIALSAWKKNDHQSTSTKSEENLCHIRKCIVCGHEGEMKTWIANYSVPKIITFIGFLLGYVPGLIFLAVYWGKYKCPTCGAIGKNSRLPEANE
ncbi:MAG: hypothetical protein WCP33_00105 [Deltaproteobacteria bacterium]